VDYRGILCLLRTRCRPVRAGHGQAKINTFRIERCKRAKLLGMTKRRMVW
jgi:hypothetical protein